MYAGYVLREDEESGLVSIVLCQAFTEVPACLVCFCCVFSSGPSNTMVYTAC